MVTWMEAFCTFAAVRASKFPGELTELMSYGASIIRGARTHGGKNWLLYDYQFRQLVAAKNSPPNWRKKDMALWNEIFSKPTKRGTTQ